MSAKFHHAGRSGFISILAGALLPVSALAQAGLSGDPFSGQAAEQRALFNGQQQFQSKSALGQLEELTGSTVDRSSSNTRIAPQAQVAQPRFDPNAALRMEVTEMVADALVRAIFSDNSAKEKAAAEAAAAQAAQAAAQAEVFRVQQELAKKARIQMAQHNRDVWDARETESSILLGGAFAVTTGTAFFGRPANPDADTVAAILGQDIGGAEQAPGDAPDVSDADSEVVDLRGSSLVVPLLRQPMPAATSTSASTIIRGGSHLPRWVYDSGEPDEDISTVRPKREVPSMKNAEFFNDWYASSLINTATETLFGLIPEYYSRLPNLPLRGLVKTIWGFKEDYESIGNPLKKKALEIVNVIGSGSQQVVTTMGNPYGGSPEAGSSYFQSVGSIGEETQTEAKYKALEIASTKVFPSPDMNDVVGPRVPEVEIRPFSQYQNSVMLNLRASELAKLYFH